MKNVLQRPMILMLGAGFLASVALFPGAVSAGQPMTAAVEQTAFVYENYLFGDEAPQAAAEVAPSSELAACVLADDCGACGGGCGAACGCGAKPWKLPQPCLLQSMGIAVGGWIQQGITFNGQNPPDGFNGPVYTNDWDDEYQLNQLWLYLHRPADNGGSGWAIGGHFDMTYGTDWRYGIQQGLEDRFQNVADSYGVVFPQMYVEVAWNDLSVKLGHFAGILSYEVVPAPMNPFYSHSYEYAAVPELVTGVLGEYKLSDQWAIQAGFHQGWMVFDDQNGEYDFMGGLKWHSLDKRTEIRYAVSTGTQELSAPGAGNRFDYSLVVQQQVTEKFKYIAVHGLGYEDNGGVGGVDEEWYGLNQYFLYTLNPNWDLNMRFEWFRDDDGGIIRGLGTVGRRGWGGSGFAGNFYELTVGTTWKPCPNVMVRPECRWDWYNGLPGTGGQLPFDGGNSNDQVIFACDVIFTY